MAPASSAASSSPGMKRTSLAFRSATMLLNSVMRGLGQVAGEHDEVRLSGEVVHGADGALQRILRIGIRRTLESPVRVGHLHEEEVLSGRDQRTAPGAEAGGEHHPAQSR